jgi:hypothetical protein
MTRPGPAAVSPPVTLTPLGRICRELCGPSHPGPGRSDCPLRGRPGRPFLLSNSDSATAGGPARPSGPAGAQTGENPPTQPGPRRTRSKNPSEAPIFVFIQTRVVGIPDSRLGYRDIRVQNVPISGTSLRHLLVLVVPDIRVGKLWISGHGVPISGKYQISDLSRIQTRMGS